MNSRDELDQKTGEPTVSTTAQPSEAIPDMYVVSHMLLFII
jgi:hypothetical protein